MMDKIIVYAYNVLFGDAILIEVADGRTSRFILIDVGNPLMGTGGDDRPLLAALKDINHLTDGKIDLYIMTHEHMDHIQGLLLAKGKGITFQIDTVWMPASSAPDYYQRFPEAKKKKMELQSAVETFQKFTGKQKLSEEFKMLLDLNARKTEDYVDFIRHAGQKPPYYLYRGCDLKGKHPFTDIGIRILAPEEDTSVYYQSVPHLDVNAENTPSAPKKGRSLPLPLPGVDGGAFYGLIERMNSAFSESIFAIDRAGNDTSLVFELTWQGKRLLFTGDAEQKSWQMMDKNAGLKPVDIYKISHHGSRTGIPPLPILEKVLPQERQKQAAAILSTYPAVLSQEPDVYPGVPDKQTVDTIKKRARKVFSTTDVAGGKPVIVTLAATG